MDPLKLYFLLNMGIFQCYDSFQGCNSWDASTKTPSFRKVVTARVDYFAQLDRCCTLLPALRHHWSRGLHWIGGCEGAFSKGEEQMNTKKKPKGAIFPNAVRKVQLLHLFCDITWAYLVVNFWEPGWWSGRCVPEGNWERWKHRLYERQCMPYLNSWIFNEKYHDDKEKHIIKVRLRV